MGRVTTDTTLAHPFVLENKRAALRRVTLGAGLVLA